MREEGRNNVDTAPPPQRSRTAESDSIGQMHSSRLALEGSPCRGWGGPIPANNVSPGATPIVAVEPDVLDVREAAAFLRCSPKVVRRLARLRQIPHRKLDRRGTRRFSRAALEQLLQNRQAA